MAAERAQDASVEPEESPTAPAPLGPAWPYDTPAPHSPMTAPTISATNTLPARMATRARGAGWACTVD
ncbi:hypothetical protein EJ357_23590 [Streptomyces cyaneochromogenes]|uniref:Uncharacterized protein n=1 Tax=Streptomyces cyaneochromogenes TaxID=2496836 RepID=A0A3Q9EUZ2_9ACTN|nr:hypothetical protein [Streptomyces cyaneochromogenes]AZQ36094.1 hypothetical protein EJ357_23590 [Streptomyces cyaneochromogenes]